jgi:hypothetical protein
MTQPQNQLAALRHYLGTKAHVITTAITAAPHEAKATGLAKGTLARQTVIGTPRYRKMARGLIASIQGRDLAPRRGAGAGELDPQTLAGLAAGDIQLGRPDHPANPNMVQRELLAEYQRVKGRAMSALGRGGNDLGWLTVLMQMDVAAAQVADYLAEQAGDPKNEWLRQLTGGQLIQADGKQFRAIAERVSGLLGGKVFDLKDKIFREISFSYDSGKTGEQNIAALAEVTARIDGLVELGRQLAVCYQSYGAVLKELGEHVGRLIDEEGWKAYATKHLGTNAADLLVSGVDLVLTGLASLVREIPYHGAGAAGAAIQVGIGRLTAVLHKAVRDARIYLLKKDLEEHMGPDEDRTELLRQAYLQAMDADQTLMAQRIFQIQKETVEEVWSVVAIPLAEIPVPLVAVTIKTFCVTICTSYYEARVVNLRESLKPVGPGMVEQVVDFVREIFLDPAEESIEDAVQKQFLEQLGELGSRVVDAAGERRGAVIDFFREKFAEIGDIAKDVATEVVISFIATVCAKLIARLIAKIASDQIAPAISGGDLRQILDRMDNVKAEVDQSLAALAAPHP